MAEVTYYFNARGDAVWTDPDNIVDNNLETFGYTSTNGAAQLLNGNDCPATDLGTITKVELRLYGYGDGDDKIVITPIFTGGDGDPHDTVPVVAPGDWTPYVDITNDTNHPDWSLWSHIQDLDCKLAFAGVGKKNTVYCAKVEIRVTYTPYVAPTVTTQAVYDILKTTATGPGRITSTGGVNCSKRGICWNTTGNPTVADDKSEETDSFGTGAFTRPMTGLTPGQHYYVKAYAYNLAGYGYGDQVEFDALPVNCEILRPDAAGDEEALTPYPANGGHNWDRVDEASTDEDDTYVKILMDTDKRDLYSLPASSGSGTINFIKVYFRCKLIDMGGAQGQAKASIKSNSTVTDGDWKDPLDYSWHTYSQQWNTNPAPPGTDAWTWDDIDALQIGVFLTCLDQEIRCTQVYVVVHYTPGLEVAPSPVSAGSLIQAPSVSGSGSAPVSPSVVATPSAVQAPSVAGSGAAPISLLPVAAQSAVVAPEVSAVAVQEVTPSPVPVSSSVQAPTASGSGSASISSSPVSAPSLVQAPSVAATGAAPISPSPVVAPSAVQSPSVSGSGSVPVSPSPLQVLSAVQVPSVSGAGSVSIAPSPTAAPSSVQAPSVSGSGVAAISPSPTSADTTVQAPEVAHTNQYVLPAPVAALSAVQGPSVSGSGAAAISSSPVATQSAVQSPVVSTTRRVTPSPVQVLTSVQAPGVSGSGIASVSPSPIQAISAIQSPVIQGAGSAPILLSPVAVISAIVAPRVLMPWFVLPPPVAVVSSLVQPKARQHVTSYLERIAELEGEIVELEAALEPKAHFRI